MDNNGNFQVMKALERARKRRNRKIIISIVQMVAILTAITLLFTFFMNVVWATPIEPKETVMDMPEQRMPGLQEKKLVEAPPVEIKDKVQEVKKEVKVQAKKEPVFPYKKHLPLPMEHQRFLYEQCQALGLDFEKALAVMEHESKFDANAIGATDDYGYFQVNKSNHQWLSEEVGTPNQPLNPKVNIQWGTYMLSTLYDYWKEKGLSGQALDDAVWSSYNKGINGFRNTGKAVEYVAKVKESLRLVKQ